MSPQINDTLQTFESYISQVDSLQTINHNKGRLKKANLYTATVKLILKSFPDGKDRCVKLIQSIPSSTHQENEQKYYLSYLKALRHALVANKEDLEAKIRKDKMKTKPIEIEIDEGSQDVTKTQDVEEPVSLKEKLLAKLSPSNSANKLDDLDKLQTEITKIEQSIIMPGETVVREPTEVKQDEGSQDVTKTQATTKETFDYHSIELDASQSKTSEERIVDEPFSELSNSVKLWSKNTLNKMKELDKLNVEIREMKTESENMLNKMKELDKLNVEIREMKTDIQSIKSVLTTLSKVFLS